MGKDPVIEYAINRWPAILPDISQWPINRLSQQGDAFLKEVGKESIRRIKNAVPRNSSIREELMKTVYAERIRLTQKAWKVDTEEEKVFWYNIRKKLFELDQPHLHEADKTEMEDALLNAIVNRYLSEVEGNFDPGVYEFAKRAIPFGFSRLLTTQIGRNLYEKWQNPFNVYEKFHLAGDLERIRELAKTSTLVMVPTHFSNLDSMVIGFGIFMVGLPAFMYGAGLNLFGIKILAYFMERLGAYKVDRRKKNPFYLETLKTYAALSIHEGAHSLFFPGGTRSRSGMIEKKLKLGLIGSAMQAQQMNLLAQGAKHRKIILVPVVINYHFVLEAPSLIKEHLEQTGQEMFLEENDPFSTSFKMFKFIFKFLRASSELALSFGPPLDLFGNEVLADGTSIDKHGRQVDIARYFMVNGKIKADDQRDMVYNQMVGEKLIDRYHRDNIVFSSHLVAFTAFAMLMKSHQSLGLYRTLRLPPEDRIIPYSEFASVCERLRGTIFRMAIEGKVNAAPHLSGDIESVIRHGLENLGIYHTAKPLTRDKNGDIFTEDITLLHFYHNRLVGYNLENYV